MPPAPPTPLETPRLLLRCWSPDDAPVMKRAVDESLAHLQPWMEWAPNEPTPLPALRERLERFRAQFEAGEEWLYGVFRRSDNALIGGLGIHRRSSDPQTLEIGYWVRVTEIGNGYASEAVGAALAAAYSHFGAARVEIRCDAANTRSARVAMANGFTLAQVLTGVDVTPQGAPRDTQVWVHRHHHAGRWPDDLA